MPTGQPLCLAVFPFLPQLSGDMDRATQGQPGKYSFCCAENEADSPWRPLHVERGIPPDRSAVTIVAAGGNVQFVSELKSSLEDVYLKLIREADAR